MNEFETYEWKNKFCSNPVIIYDYNQVDIAHLEYVWNLSHKT